LKSLQRWRTLNPGGEFIGRVKLIIAREQKLKNKKNRREKNRSLPIRVAGWFVFKPKIQIWVNFGGSSNGKSWYIL
jgi:hypothetical protein